MCRLTRSAFAALAVASVTTPQARGRAVDCANIATDRGDPETPADWTAMFLNLQGNCDFSINPQTEDW